MEFDVTHALPFLPENWLSSRLEGLTNARSLLETGRELERLIQTARIIREQSQVLVVIGIGGSYLGARAVLELLTSPNYNLLCRDRPQIFFTGNTLSSDALSELLEYIPNQQPRTGENLILEEHGNRRKKPS